MKGLAVVVLVFADGCRTQTGRPSVERERLAVNAWTVPPGATVARDSGIASQGMAAKVVWEVADSRSWKEYLSWVAASYKGGYNMTKSDPAKASFVRYYPGDRFQLDLEVIALGPPVRVRITLTATPD